VSRVTVAQNSSEAVMASLVVIALAITTTGVVFGAFIAISFTIRREDRARTLSWDAPDRTAQNVRTLTGYTRRG
jgi:ABC-type arginine/histidine transport system permease subunit